MKEELLEIAFEAIKNNKPIPKEALISDEDVRIKSFLTLNHIREKHKFDALSEVINKIVSYIYWQEINVIDIEPENLSNSFLILKNLIGKVEPLVYVMFSANNKKEALVSKYISNKIKCPVITKFFLINSNEENYLKVIKEIKNNFYPNSLYLISEDAFHTPLFLDNLYKTASHKDLMLLQIQAYSLSFIDKVKKQIKVLKENKLLPSAFQHLFLSSSDGNWHIEFKNSFLKLFYLLSEDVKLKFKNQVVSLQRGDKILFLEYYLPKANKLFNYLESQGFNILYVCKEENHSILILLFNKK